MAFILGKKIGMSQVFDETGKKLPVTVVLAEPIKIVQIKTEEKDGYTALQFGALPTCKKLTKPISGHLKELGNMKILKERRLSETDLAAGGWQKGVTIDVSTFQIGDKIKVSGLSKAKGFQGPVKRHGFHGMPASRGHKSVTRSPGSIGQRFPQHTLKGMRMAGRMGGGRVSVRGLKIVAVDKEKNLLMIKGAVPGRRGTILEIITI